MSFRKLVIAVAMAACTLSACGQAERQVTAANVVPSSTTPAPAAFDATVSITDFDPTCRQVKCWLPTQFAPKLIERQTVSLYDAWPMDGDSVRVLCVTREGGVFLNKAGHPTTDWYGIFVPEDKVDPGAKEKAEKVTVEGKEGRRAYIGVSWIKSEPKVAPPC